MYFCKKIEVELNDDKQQKTIANIIQLIIYFALTKTNMTKNITFSHLKIVKDVTKENFRRNLIKTR